MLQRLYSRQVQSKGESSVFLPSSYLWDRESTQCAWVKHIENTGFQIILTPACTLGEAIGEDQRLQSSLYLSTPHRMPTLLRLSIREKYSIDPTPISRALTHIFYLMVEAGHETKGSESLLKELVSLQQNVGY